MDAREELKRQAAHEAVRQVESDMVVGLGTGSTAKYAVERLGELIRKGRLKNIVGIPSSVQTENLAAEVGVPLTSFDAHPVIDITIDGADEVDPELNLIKGGGGALLREKVLAQSSRRNIIIVDESKLSDRLGTRWALPVEVIPFARRTEEAYLISLGATPNLRIDDKGRPVLTDQKNLIYDAAFGPIADPQGLAAKLNDRSGIMAQGLFIGLAHEVIVAGSDDIRHMTR